ADGANLHSLALSLHNLLKERNLWRESRLIVPAPCIAYACAAKLSTRCRENLGSSLRSRGSLRILKSGKNTLDEGLGYYALRARRSCRKSSSYRSLRQKRILRDGKGKWMRG